MVFPCYSNFPSPLPYLIGSTENMFNKLEKAVWYLQVILTPLFYSPEILICPVHIWRPYSDRVTHFFVLAFLNKDIKRNIPAKFYQYWLRGVGGDVDWQFGSIFPLLAIFFQWVRGILEILVEGCERNISLKLYWNQNIGLRGDIKGFSVFSSRSNLFQWAELVFTILVQGHETNICMKLFWNWLMVWEEMSFGWQLDYKHKRFTIAQLEHLCPNELKRKAGWICISTKTILYISEKDYLTVKHSHDIWHAAKSLGKKIIAVSYF